MTILKYAFYVCILLASIRMACTSCGDGYFSDEDGKCLRCPVHCPFCDSNEKCLSCDNGYWGSVCEIPCSKCKNGTSCEKTNGFCLEACRDGLSGILCDAQCSDKCSSCNRTNVYTCLKCAPGRYPSGSCGSVCLGCSNTACREDGRCTSGCVKGYWGNNCESVCSEHCLNNIIILCEWKSGNCTHGCVGEYTGPRCVNGKEKTRTTIFVLVGIGIALIFVAVVVVIVVCIRRKRQNHRESKRPAGRSFLASEQGSKNAETSPLIGASNVGGGQFQLVTVQKGMPKLQELLEIIQHRTEENYRSEFESLPGFLNTDATSDEEQVLPFKENSVLVEGKTKEAHTTNASLITAARFLDMPDAVMYIASGGPTNEVHAGFTLFWMMLWQLKCQTVVMLYNINEKNKRSEQYWPDTEDKYGDLNVRSIAYTTIHNQKYIKGTFEVSAEKQEQDTLCVKLMHYYEWPEKGIADNIQKLLEFREEVNHARQDCSRPLVVLGRKGAGRTGTYIALDMLLRMVDDITKSDDEKTKVIDVFACVMHLREQRMKMVETVEQYKFLYQALSYYISRISKDKDRQETQTQDDSDRRQVKGEAKA